VYQDDGQVHGDYHGRGLDQRGEQGGESQQDSPQVEDDDAGPIQHQSQAPHTRVHQIVQRDHTVDNILGVSKQG
jgi:hypothetical protein